MPHCFLFFYHLSACSVLLFTSGKGITNDRRRLPNLSSGKTFQCSPCVPAERRLPKEEEGRKKRKKHAYKHQQLQQGIGSQGVKFELKIEIDFFFKTQFSFFFFQKMAATLRPTECYF